MLFLKAIDENDDTRAYNSLGTLYEMGLGVKKILQLRLNIIRRPPRKVMSKQMAI
ncbi:hypothetical protein SALWKB12_0907 [Snodgrassella communis]|nr:hypothetical protein SALWKB12_0907 [Snodgrassella communis]